MTTKHLTALTLLALATPLMAQQPQERPHLTGEGQYRYDEATQLWLHTAASAGLTLDSTHNRGYAEFHQSHRSGDYHRVQEGSQANRLAFRTERYQHIGKYLYGYGRFEFDYGRTKNRVWSDVRRTYHANPFISGSAVAGKYDLQDFDLTARVGTVDLGGWRFGLGLDYKVGDLSRLRDPRSRSRLLDYRLTPSATRTMGRHTIGMGAWYHRYKEKLPGLTTVQEDPNLMYYQMTGLEAATGTIGGYKGYEREYVNHTLGAELQYGYRSQQFRSVNAVSISRGAENMYEQYKREPGKYYTYIYKVQSHNRIVAARALHELDLDATWQQAYADEYRPELVITIDSLTSISSRNYVNRFTYRKRFQLKTFDASLRYRLNFTDAQAVRSYVGLAATLSTVSQKHLLPTSKQNLAATDLHAEYGQSLLPGRRLWLALGAGLHLAHKADLRLADVATPYAQSVLLPDQAYYRANHFTGSLALTYQFPMTLKGYRSLWYVRADAQTLRARHGLERNTVGLTIGVFN